MRTNRYKMPVIGGLFSTARRTFDGSYYGYVNSDVLLTVQIFEVIRIRQYNVFKGALGPDVGFRRGCEE